jgi:L-aminopeptidase/D-esterase-like protein
MNDLKVSDLTVSQLQRLIRETVQEAVAEVIIEFNAIAEADEQLRMEAELAEYLRASMQGQSHSSLLNSSSRVDD